LRDCNYEEVAGKVEKVEIVFFVVGCQKESRLDRVMRIDLN